MSTAMIPQAAPARAPQPSAQDRLRAAFQISHGRIVSILASAWTDERKVSFRLSVVGRDGQMTTVHRLVAETATIGLNDLLWSLLDDGRRDWICRPSPIGAGFVVSHRSYLSCARRQRALEPGDWSV